jgi:hypothetical protein
MKPPPESAEDKANRESVERIANNIAALAKSVSQLLSGPLKRKALVILLAHSSGLSQVAIGNVLIALENLKQDWINE